MKPCSASRTMALSRFWAAIVGGSILYIFALLATGRLYTLNHLVNGKQNEPLVINEIASSTLQQSDPALYSNLASNKAAGVQSGDALYILQDTGVVQVCRGKQSADGIFPTCKNTILDLWLPLI